MSENKNKLQEILDDILQDKNTNLTPDNLKQGVTCLGIKGNLQEGIDTSDATAIASDISNGKTAYVNKNKITGTLIDNNNQITLDNQDDITAKTGDNYFDVHSNMGVDTIVRANNQISIRPSFEKTANAIGLTADKIIEGNTILGIEGTGKTSEDLQEQLDTQDIIIQQLQDELVNKTSGSVKPNIFMQETEPEEKKGIWVKSSINYDIVDDHKIFTPIAHLSKNISSSGFYKIDNWLYIFGGYWYNSELKTGETTSRCYKINLDTFEEIELSSIPNISAKLYDMECVHIEGKIYMTTGAVGGTNIYVYDIVSDNWTINSITNMVTPSKGYTIYGYNNTLYLFANSRAYTIDTSTFEATSLGIISGINFSYLTRFTPYNSSGNTALVTGHYWANNYPIILFYLDTLAINGRIDDFKQQAAVFCIPDKKTVYSFSGMTSTHTAITEVYRYDDIEMHSGKVKLLGNTVVPIKGCAYCVYNGYLYTFGGYVNMGNSSLPSARCDYIYKVPLEFNNTTFNNAIVLNDRNQYIRNYTVELYDGNYVTLSNINIYENGSINSNRQVYLGDGYVWTQVFGGVE